MRKNLFHKESFGAWRFWTVAAFTVALDQLTKLAAVKFLVPAEGAASKSVPVIDGFLSFTHATNEGAAWGILSGQTYLLSSIAIVALAALWLFRKSLGFSTKGGQILLGFFAGGVIGNLIDRVLYGHVVDFIDVWLPIIDYHWPIFNIADCGISISVALYIIGVLREDIHAKR